MDLNDLHSECSCPYGINCKHGVAVLLQYMEGEYSDADNVTKSLDRMSRESNGEYASADELASFIKVNESVLSKEQVFHILEFLVDNCEDFGYFYDDYSDSNYGEEIFENLCDAFVKKQIEVKDFVRLKEISERDNYDMLGAFINRLPEH